MGSNVSKKVILNNHDQFEDKIENIIKYGLELINDKLPGKMEKKSKEEKSMLLEALLLRSCALWESFVENEIVFLVSLESSNLNKEMGLPEHSKLSVKLVRALLFCGRYRDYWNIEQSKSTFKRVIKDKQNLFNNITIAQITKIRFIYKMRNYLSHYSVFSRKELLKAYDKAYKRKKFLQPGYFLMKEKGKYFENLIHNFKLMSISMKQKLQ
jgi:hypothetical protein